MMTAQSITASDAEVIREWVSKDPHHKYNVDPAFFCNAAPGETVYKWGEPGEEPLFFVKVENVARVHIQFSPNAGKGSNAKELEHGYLWLVDGLKQRGYREMIFESIHAPLIRFCRRVFGFKKREHDYSRGL